MVSIEIGIRVLHSPLALNISEFCSTTLLTSLSLDSGSRGGNTALALGGTQTSKEPIVFMPSDYVSAEVNDATPSSSRRTISSHLHRYSNDIYPHIGCSFNIEGGTRNTT